MCLRIESPAPLETKNSLNRSFVVLESTSDKGTIRDHEMIARVWLNSWYTFAVPYTVRRVPIGNPWVIIKVLPVLACRDRPYGAITACSGTKTAFLKDDFRFLPISGKYESGDGAAMISERHHISTWWIWCSW